MSKLFDHLYKLKGYIAVALLPLILIFIIEVAVVQMGIRGVPSSIHGLSAMILQHIFVFALLHIVILSGVYVYLTQRISRILSTKKLSEVDQKKLLNMKFWFLGMVTVLECVFILQVFL